MPLLILLEDHHLHPSTKITKARTRARTRANKVVVEDVRLAAKGIPRKVEARARNRAEAKARAKARNRAEANKEVNAGKVTKEERNKFM